MKKLLIAFILLHTGNITQAQQLLVWDEHRPLAWQYFQGLVNTASPYSAESYAEIRYNYTFLNASNFHFTVEAVLHKDASWVKDGCRNDKLLRHEQLHFDIAALYAKRLEDAFNSYSYSSNFKEEIAQLFSHYKEAYNKIQQLYDEQTLHSTNTQKQAEWETFVKTALQRKTDLAINEAGQISLLQ